MTETPTRENILSELGLEPTMARTISTASKLGRVTDPAATGVRFAILRNVTLEPGLPSALKVESARAALDASVYLGNFDNVQQDVLDDRSELYVFRPDLVVVALRLQVLTPRLVTQFASLDGRDIEELRRDAAQRVVTTVKALRERSSATVLVHNFELAASPAYGILDPQRQDGQQNVLRALNDDLAAALRDIPGSYIVDVDRLLAQVGYDAGLDDRYWHIGRAPYSFAFQRRLAVEYVKFARALKGKNKKCLVLDCDNTLWGGVVGEDGLGGIKLGATNPGSAFVELHAAVLDLFHRGILLALNSKNNQADAMEVFERHPDSLLKPQHFVAKRINWQDKVTNLREIAAELNIGLDSLVFVDDNPFECRYVRESLPEVAVVELPQDPSRYARALRALPYFETLVLSDEDRRRSDLYHANARRMDLQAEAGSMDDYLRSLGMVLTIAGADAFSLPRIAQLTQKTNQFNVTTRRYSEADVRTLMDDPSWHVYYAGLRDKFDDSGIIAVALVHDEDATARIDTFLMSCRVIGRGVERALLQAIARDSVARGRDMLLGEFIATPKNALVAKFFEDAGFSERAGSERRWWTAPAQGVATPAPDWFARIDREGADAA